MIILETTKFLKVNADQIINLVQFKTSKFDIDGSIFNNVVNHLVIDLPLGRNNIVWRDKAHEQLAIAIIHSMWCGWLSQAKANRGAYKDEYVKSFEKLISDAFKIGQDYATIKK